MISSNDPILEFSPLFGSWEPVEFLGAGSNARVYKVVNRDSVGDTQDVAAVKMIVFPRDPSEWQTLRQLRMDAASINANISRRVNAYFEEINRLRQLQDENNVIRYFMSRREERQVLDEQDGRLYTQHVIFILMELLTPLPRWLENRELSEQTVARMGRDIASALDACEKQGISHRDIKEDNIFVDEKGRFKVGDFGEARNLARGGGATPGRGTPMYSAPETLQGRYDVRSDMYSLGLVMYRLLNNDLFPFMKQGTQLLSEDVLEQAYAQRMATKGLLPAPVNASEGMRRIILKCCRPKPEARYDSADALRHDLDTWLNSYQAETMLTTRRLTNNEKRRLKLRARRRKLWAYGLGALLLVGLGLSFSQGWIPGFGQKHQAESPAASLSVSDEAMLPGTELPTESLISAPTVSPTETPTAQPTEAPTAPPADTPSPAPTATTAPFVGYARVAVDFADLYNTTSQDRRMLQVLPQDSVVQVLSQSFEGGERWHRVQMGEAFGFVHESQLAPMDAAQEAAYLQSLITPAPTSAPTLVPTPAPTPVPTPVPVLQLLPEGINNLPNGGMMVRDEQYLYVQHAGPNTRFTLYQVMPNMQAGAVAMEQMRTDSKYSLFNHRLYFYSKSTGKEGLQSFAMQNGFAVGEPTRLAAGVVKQYAVDADGVYYAVENQAGIYRVNHDGSNKQQLAPHKVRTNNNVVRMNVLGGTLYYINDADHALYSVPTNGSASPQRISVNPMHYFIFAEYRGQVIVVYSSYASSNNALNSSTLKAITLSGQPIETLGFLGNLQSRYINSQGSWLYYADSANNRFMKRINLEDPTEQQTLLKREVGYPQLFDGWLGVLPLDGSDDRYFVNLETMEVFRQNAV